MRIVGYNQVLAAAGLEKRAAPSNLAQDFLGGMDPFGMWTMPYGQEAERAGLSPGEHALKRGVGTVGGAVGGSLLVPSAIIGTVEAAKGFLNTQGTLKKRLAGAATGGVAGFKHPVKSVLEGRRAVDALSRVAEGGTGLTAKELEHLKYLSKGPMGNSGDLGSRFRQRHLERLAPGEESSIRLMKDYVSAMDPEDLPETISELRAVNPTLDSYLGMVEPQYLTPESVENFRKQFLKGDFDEYLTPPKPNMNLSPFGKEVERWKDPARIHRFTETPTGRAAAYAMLPRVKQMLGGGQAQLALGGAIGGGGAFYQYGAGQRAERETTPWGRLKRRLGIRVE